VTLARTLAALALAAGLLGAAAPVPHVAASRPAAAAPSPRRTALVLERYLAALEGLSAPRYISFEYSIEQGGGTDISELHRIYRAGRDSRDELIEADGQRLRLPRVRIRHDAVDRYALAAIAPTPARYTFSFVSSAKSGDHLTYTYGTQAKSAGAFSVDEITIDGASFLPTQLRFRSSAGGVHGHGTLFYAKADRYWLIREARADALAKDGPIGERIVWSAYRFPSTLPSATFAGQVADPIPAPTAAP
jgi:hypothetical protein